MHTHQTHKPAHTHTEANVHTHMHKNTHTDTHAKTHVQGFVLYAKRSGRKDGDRDRTQ